MGCSNSKTVKTSSSPSKTKHRSPNNGANKYQRKDGPLQGVVGEEIPHVSISELGNQEDLHDGSVDSSANGARPHLRQKKKSKNNKNGGSTTQRLSDSNPAAVSDDEPFQPMVAVTKRSLSELKRLRTGDKVRTWQAGGDADQQNSSLANLNLLLGGGAENNDSNSGAAAPKKQGSGLPGGAAHQRSLSNARGGPDDGTNFYGVQRPQQQMSNGLKANDDDGGNSSTESAKADLLHWEKRISALASRRHVVVPQQKHQPKQQQQVATIDSASPHLIGVVNDLSFANTTVTTNASPLLAMTATVKSLGATHQNQQQQQQQQKFVVVAKVNNPTTGINLVYRKSEQVIGVGSSATVYLGSVTTTVGAPVIQQTSAATSSSSPQLQQQQQTRKFLTAVKEILVSPPAILMESPSGEQLTTQQKETAVDAIRTTQDVVQMLRLEFRLLKSLDACPQVVRVLHVAVTQPDGSGGGGEQQQQQEQQAQKATVSGGGATAAISDSQQPVVNLGPFPNHFRPQRARMFLEYVRHGTLTNEVRRISSLFHIPALSELRLPASPAVNISPSAGLLVASPLGNAVSPVSISSSCGGGFPRQQNLTYPAPSSTGDSEPRLHELMVRAYMRDVLLGLAYLHENGCIHRDVKPQNILVHSLVEEMFDTYFPICLDDDIVKYTVPCEVDSDVENFEEALYRPKKPSYLNQLNLLSNNNAAALDGAGAAAGSADNKNVKNDADLHPSAVVEDAAALPAVVVKTKNPNTSIDSGDSNLDDKQAQMRLADVEAIVAESCRTPTDSKKDKKNKKKNATIVVATTAEQLQQSDNLLGGKHRGSHYALDGLVPVSPNEDATTAPAASAERKGPTGANPTDDDAAAAASSTATTIVVLASGDDNGNGTVKTINRRSVKYHHPNHRQKHKTLIKLSDFGSARWTIPTDAEQGEGGAAGFLRDTMTAGCKTTMNVVGTAPYMSPEAIRGRFTAASDIWSFGITFLELLLPVSTNSALPSVGGAAVWRHKLMARDSFQLILQIASLQEPDHVPELPLHISPEARDMLRKCFAMRPGDRPTAVELLNSTYFASTWWLTRRLKRGEIEPLWQKK
ncbi:protein kinase, putative [Bodo saltans]|uniref:Protein kinase, putative n=1 Tax=Bodo saltans TaxID=75058 RepID=A0A0S4JIJ9_BODSA|nr:protein kinase, putative [Bodo saltans]|eukprot:CUG90181.1 protein kinase, putative [Bodo saltans]